MVLGIAGTAGAMTMGGQSHDLTAILMGTNMSSGGPVTGGNIGQAGGTVQVNDGWAMGIGQEAGLVVQGINIMGPGMAMTAADVSQGQMLATGGGTGMAAQGSNVDLMTTLQKAPGLGGGSVTNSAVSNQAEIVNTPAGSVMNTNTSAVSTIAGAGPCSTGGVQSNVSVDYCGEAAFVNPCPPPQCPPPCPPCPNPCDPCPNPCDPCPNPCD
jgi:hypothetical protein